MRFLRTQLYKPSGRVKTGCISSVGRVWPSRSFSSEARVERLLLTAGNVHLPTFTPPRSRHRKCIRLHGSRHLLDRGQTRFQSTAAAYESSTSKDAVGGGEDTEEPYTGIFDEQIPTQAGKYALENSLVANHAELFNLTLFCERTRKRLCEPGGVLRFSQFPVWDAILPILAQRLGLHHIVIKEGHPYFECVPQGEALHVFVTSGDLLPTSKDASQPLENILLDHISAEHIRHWLHEFRNLAEVSHSNLIRLLMTACRYNPLAVPTLELALNDHPTLIESTGLESRTPVYRLKLHNENHDILIIQDLGLDPKIPAGSLADAIMVYIESVASVVTSTTSGNFRVSHSQWDFVTLLRKAAKELDLGLFTFEDTAVRDLLSDLSGLDLWKVEIRTAKHGQLGPATLWSGRKNAHRMAAIHALLSLKEPLQDAYASGRLSPVEYQEFAHCWGEKVSDIEQRKPATSNSLAQQPVFHEIQVNEEIVSTMIETLRNLMKSGFQSSYEWTSSRSADLELDTVRPTASLAKASRLDNTLYKDYWKRRLSATNESHRLPVRDDNICSNIIRTIETSNITIITAATGSGKTTQVPQIIFDHYITAKNGSMCNIVCTQPRRVSTISVATRVASERHQSIGQEVGYKVRFDVRQVRANCGITYMTSGYLLRLLESEPLGILQSHSHIILDEVHARDVDTDLLLTALKNIFDRRVLLETPKTPKIILMSATINADFFRSYFEDVEPQIKISTIDVPGRMYYVEERRLDQVLTELQETHPHELNTVLENSEVREYVDEQMHATVSTESEPLDDEAMADLQGNATSDKAQAIPRELLVPTPLLHLLVVRLLSTTESGDILVFLPGLAEIEALELLLLNSPLSQSKFSDSEKHKMFKLHSALYETNYDVFEAVPSGCRRVILATNIAETSITLADVKFVIDTGLSRQATFDQVTQSGTFGIQWISKAEVMQRKGRAGRTHAGVYYGIYSQARYEAMAVAPTPEILRTSLDHLVLRNAASRAFRLLDYDTGEGDGNGEVLAGQALLTAPSPPERMFVAAAARQLRNIRALTPEGNPTPMGRILSQLPMNPAAGKAVLLGLIFKCLDTLVVYGALREEVSLMSDPDAVGAVVDRRRILAGPNDDDKWADSRAFFLYDSRRREKNNDAAVELKESLSLRHDAYCEYAQISKQTFETLLPLLGLSEYDDTFWPKPGMFTPLFPFTPRGLNTHSTNADLVKALAFSTLGTRFACWYHKHWKTHNHPRVLPHPKSVNHGGSRRAVLAHRLRRESGDLLSYGTMRHIMRDKYPWLYETATHVPLTAILFAESVSLLEEESAFVINNWVKYRLSSEDEGRDTRRTAKIIWEYRKALDRFLTHAMQMISLEPHKVKKVRNGELSVDDFNTFFGTKDNEFRDIIVNSVVKILGIDAKDRSERIAARILDEHGGEEVATVDDAIKEELEPSIESEPVDEDESESENDDDDEEQVNYNFKMVDQRKKQLTFIPVPVVKKKTMMTTEEDDLEKRLLDMLKGVMAERKTSKSVANKI